MASIFLALLALLQPVQIDSETVSVPFLPGLHQEMYSQPGDVNIGALVNILENSKTHPAETCSSQVTLSAFTLEKTEPIAFAVDFVNRNPNILPNISLGFIIRGVCPSSGIALGTALSFLPASRYNTCNASHSTSTIKSSDPWLTHDVIGAVGVGWSKLTLPISSLYAVGHLPIVGTTETSDELSNKRKHPYFFRVVPPDMHQIQAMLKFISTNNWSYISVVYEDGSYGQKAFDTVQQNVGKHGICIATNHRLIQPVNYDFIAYDLLLNYRARVVVVFIEPSSFKQILQAIHNRNSSGYFIWVASDSLVLYQGYDYKGADYDLAIGSFTFDIQTTYVPTFYDYLKRQRVSSTKNPWMKPVWEYLFDCSYGAGTCDSSVDILQSKKFKLLSYTVLRMDAVLTLAQAAHDLISKTCPNVRGKEANDCISGELLREYLKNTTVEGFNGRLNFDNNQDLKGKYMISQIVYDYFKSPLSAGVTTEKRLFRKRIGVYHVSTDSLSNYQEDVSWSHMTLQDGPFIWTTNLNSNQVPQSVCSTPCRIGEYKIEKELPCCWECRKCRDNERLIEDNTTCESCPSFMWPDSATGFTTCMDTPHTYPMLNDPIPIMSISLTLTALIVTLIVILSYITYRNERVIKASSRELSVIQLFAIFMGYSTVILLQIKPSDTICRIIFFSFCMSFSLLYSPLLVKTIRICRIFRCGIKNEKPRFIGPISQLLFATCLIIIQITLCIGVYILFLPGARLTQPIWTEKLVELSCDLTFPGITSFLGYNIVLVSLCSVFAFMVRKLPDNFNESKFISMCVTTTLLIFIAFIPAYFTADREFIKVFLLSVALFLNHSVALIFLFVPKIYAARFLPPEEGNFSNTRS